MRINFSKKDTVAELARRYAVDESAIEEALKRQGREPVAGQSTIGARGTPIFPDIIEHEGRTGETQPAGVPPAVPVSTSGCQAVSVLEEQKRRVEVLRRDDPPIAIAESPAVRALISAGYGPEIVATGPDRTTGLGITLPLAPVASRSFHLPLGEWARSPLPPEIQERLAGMRIAVTADGEALGWAETAAEYLTEVIGVGEVVVIAPQEGADINYAVSTAAALDMLQQNEVDRVVAFCGNGLGALDIANIYAEGTGDVSPAYGDNLWSVVDSQRGDTPSRILCLGARLCSVPKEGVDPMPAFLKAFLDDPQRLDNLASADQPQVGVDTWLVDDKRDRIQWRTLASGRPFEGKGITAQAKLTLSELRQIRSMQPKPVVFYDPNCATAEALAQTLGEYLINVSVRPWESEELPEGEPGQRILFLSEKGLTSADRRWAFWRPDGDASHRIHRASYWSGVFGFVRSASADQPLILDLPAAALTDNATGGIDNDVARLFSKVFLLTRPDDGKIGRRIYGRAVELARAHFTQNATPSRGAEWSGDLQSARDAARIYRASREGSE